MIKLIPAIIAKDFDELKRKIKLIEPYFSVAQLDVMDGRFVPSETFKDITEIKKIKTALDWEIHLMAKNPNAQIYSWSLLKPKRFIFHYESLLTDKILLKRKSKSLKLIKSQINTLIKKIKNYSMEAGMAINPETPLEAVEPYLKDLDLVLLMTVNPGLGGQPFQEAVLQKVQNLRQIWPDGNIELDGGIKIDLTQKCLTAGANFLAVGSGIFEAEDIEKAVLAFRREIELFKFK